eukprot:CAMPEP_0114498912 /NCGR_PEP_ID=MMETSP0109-20121206/7131_1 /TAXON_ID=29199 /ORGANISM="Chlorarachnion reptans, Strain CCCM449" /LENGTH=627 /DNA_ID=CAMNT_0001676433 /DNA_START=27 /DNA_END=1910 /DNA_ORIENTATION=+
MEYEDEVGNDHDLNNDDCDDIINSEGSVITVGLKNVAVGPPADGNDATTSSSSWCGSSLCRCILLPAVQFHGFMKKLTDAFGWRFIFISVATYGINQGIGNEFNSFTTDYFFSENLHLGPAEGSTYSAFSSFPWTIKAFYGMAMDMIPIMGYHKGPYILVAGVVGSVAWLLLGSIRSISVIGATILLIASNFGRASPDVAIDAAVAERSIVRPELAADLQALCWGALGIGGVIASLTVGVLQDSVGTRGVYLVGTFTSIIIAIPAAMGFLAERREPPNNRNVCQNIKRGFGDPIGKWVFLVAIIVSLSSVALGLLSVFGHAVTVKASVTFGIAIFVVAPSVWIFLGKVSPVLARAATFIFLRGALQPSTFVLKYWYLRNDANCAKGFPCLSAEFIGWMDTVGYLFMFLGTVFYQKIFRTWSYRSTFALAQVLMTAFSLLDIFWVTRSNLKIGMPDEAFLFGSEVLEPILRRLSHMPMLILAAKLCPPGVEATLFALNMSLSNFGELVGMYLGSALLEMLGVKRGEFNNLELYIIIRSLAKLLPVFLIKFLVPLGSPDADAIDMSRMKQVENKDIEESTESIDKDVGEEEEFPDNDFKGEVVSMVSKDGYDRILHRASFAEGDVGGIR